MVRKKVIFSPYRGNRDPLLVCVMLASNNTDHLAYASNSPISRLATSSISQVSGDSLTCPASAALSRFQEIWDATYIDVTTSVLASSNRQSHWQTFTPYPRSETSTEPSSINSPERLLDRLGDMLEKEEFDESFLAPTAYSVSTMRQFLRVASKSFGDDIRNIAFVPDGNGGLEANLTMLDRDLQLIVPSDRTIKRPYLFFKEGGFFGIREITSNNVLVGMIGWVTRRPPIAY